MRRCLVPLISRGVFVRSYGRSSGMQVADEIWSLFSKKEYGKMGELFESVAATGVVHELKSFNLMLRRAEIEGSPENSLAIFQSMRAQGVVPNINSYRFLINALADAGRLQEASKYLQECLETNASSLEKEATAICSMVARIIVQHSPNESPAEYRARVDAVLRKVQGQVPFNSSVWAALIKAKTFRLAPQAARSVVEQSLHDAREQGIDLDVVLLESVVAALADAGLTEEAWKYFKLHGEACLAAQGRARSAFFLLSRMVKIASSFGEAKQLLMFGVQEPMLFHHVLLVLQKDKHLPPSQKVSELNALLQLMKSKDIFISSQSRAVAAAIFASSSSDWKSALKLAALEETSSEGVAAIIKELSSQRGREREALAIWDDILAAKWLDRGLVTSDLFEAVIQACAIRVPPRNNVVLDSRLSLVLEALALTSIQPSESLLSTLLRVLGLGGKLNVALDIFKELIGRQKSVTHKLVLTMLRVLAADENHASVIPPLIRFVSETFGLKPNLEICNAWLESLRFEGNFQSALEVYREMRRHEIVPSARTFMAMFSILDSAGPSSMDTEKLEANVKMLLRDWESLLGQSGKNVNVYNALLRLLQNHPSRWAEGEFWGVYEQMSTSPHAADWPNSQTYHLILKGMIRRGKFAEAVKFLRSASVEIDQRASQGHESQGFWKHSIEYLVGNLLGEEQYDLAEEAREWARTRGFHIGPLSKIESAASMDDD